MGRALLSLLFLLVTSPADATVMMKMELRDLVGRADAVFVGRVVKVEARWSEDRRHIVTDATFLVGQAVHAAAANTQVVVRSLGGAVGGIGMKVPGSPEFRVGQDLLLFTDRRGGHRYVTGMMQGVFAIARDATSGRTVVRAAGPGGMALARRTPEGRLQITHEAAPPTVPLDAFLQQIRSTMAACAKEKNRCRE